MQQQHAAVHMQLVYGIYAYIACILYIYIYIYICVHCLYNILTVWWHYIILIRYGTVRYGAIWWYGIVLCMVWFGMGYDMYCDVMWYGVVWCVHFYSHCTEHSNDLVQDNEL